MPLRPYTTIAAPAQDEFVERRSRFIGHIAPVTTEEEAMAFLKGLREKHYDARHNVFAFVLRDGRSRFSDDGEPSGTGGKPVMDVITGAGLSDVAIVVTRYFGGVLLGTGGLTHAYSQGASLAVAAAKLRPMRPATAMQITCDYGFYGQLSYLLPRFEVFTAGSDFGEKVTLDLRCPTENVKPLCSELTELTSGQLCPTIGQEEYLDLSGAKSGF